MHKNWLATYILVCLLFDAALIAAFMYVVFWKGYSGWWFLFLVLTLQGSFNGFKYSVKLLTTH